MVISPNKWELDVQGYLNTCSITDSTPRRQIRDFAAGVNDLGLWNSMVCWPLRSSQNAGTGTTAYSLGGLGTFNGTLVNGPSWGADGIDFVAASSTAISTPLDVSGLRQFTVMVATDPSAFGSFDAMVGAWGATNYLGIRRSQASQLEFLVSSGGTQRVYITATVGDWRVYGWGTQGANSVATDSGVEIGTLAFVPDQTGAVSLRIGELFAAASPYNGKIGWVFFIKDAELTTAQQLSVYTLYKSTLGQGLGLP